MDMFLVKIANKGTSLNQLLDPYRKILGRELAIRTARNEVSMKSHAVPPQILDYRYYIISRVQIVPSK